MAGMLRPEIPLELPSLCMHYEICVSDTPETEVVSTAPDICASFQYAVLHHLCRRLQRAFLFCELKSLLPAKKILVSYTFMSPIPCLSASHGSRSILLSYMFSKYAVSSDSLNSFLTHLDGYRYLI